MADKLLAGGAGPLLRTMRLLSLNADEVAKPVRKLAKMLKKFPRNPGPDEVHDLRTRTRRVEANVQALGLDKQPRARRLLRLLAPIRKSAGQVRDLDVLSGLAAGLHDKGEESCLIELIEHLGARRQKKSKRLYRAVNNSRSKTRNRLRRFSKRVQRSLQQSNPASGPAANWPAEIMSESVKLEDELRRWPRLTSSNLHAFRLKVKELRYILQLDKNADPEFVDNLGQVKDQIGEWHDWMELTAIAEDLLDHGAECQLLKAIRATTRAKFQRAISIAEKVRRKYLVSPIPHLLPRTA